MEILTSVIFKITFLAGNDISLVPKEIQSLKNLTTLILGRSY